MADPPSLTLRDLAAHSVTELKTVGDALAERLGSMGIGTVLDLLEHYPRRYHDRRHTEEIANLAIGEEATVYAEVKKVTARRTRQRRAIVETEVFDGTSYLRLTFFNQPWRERQLAEGTEAAFFGRVEHYRGRRQMINPVVDILGKEGDETGALVPVYPASGKADVHTWQLRRFVMNGLERTRQRGFADPLDDDLRAAHDLVDRTTAYWGIHRPDSMDDVQAARRRLTFDEFLRMQVGLVARKRAIEREQGGIAHSVDGSLVERFRAGLPFTLTDDQEQVVRAVARDMAVPAPMHRLLQGEVGSGKTVVALSALLMAVQGGYQGAFMAPTEVLAEQHNLTLHALLEGLTVLEEGSLLGERPVGVALLTNRTKAAERRRIAEGLANGTIDILVGTHALIYEGVEFARLGLVVVDEQHRFGVEQRDLLRAKGGGRTAQSAASGTPTSREPANGGGRTAQSAASGTPTPSEPADGGEPDVLVMTATPIPRTAAMLIYGDLDRSELRELPAGRAPITTEIVGPSPLERVAVYERLRTEIAAGRQAYVVCPLVQGTERTQAKAATEEYERLRDEELVGLRIGLLHGQMASNDKEVVMREFREGDLDVLVATTVIEVGVDVPNATVMIVEDADRFGLLQLHQLRGRIGRGAHRSWCYLLADPSTPEGSARLEAMRDSNDGFDLAERDLDIRGAGEVFGERQSGFSDLKLGRLPRDEPVVIEARAVAEGILDADPELAEHAQLREEVEDLLGDTVDFLFKS
ncbi:MAG: ATP-dependent DNA helicase RecG [Acidimicrobiia bacterium]